MDMQSVVDIAGRHGIAAGNMNKIEIIRAIQRSEGYSDCFLTNVSDCSQTDCLWREDCSQAMPSAMALSPEAVETGSGLPAAKKRRAKAEPVKKSKSTTNKRTR